MTALSVHIPGLFISRFQPKGTPIVGVIELFFHISHLIAALRCMVARVTSSAAQPCYQCKRVMFYESRCLCSRVAHVLVPQSVAASS